MKKFILQIAFLLSAFCIHAQDLTSTQWDSLKRTGHLDGSFPERFADPNASGTSVSYRLASNVYTPHPASSSCACWQTRDASFSVVPFVGGVSPDYRNDDGFTNAISIPFSFCLYGTSYNQLYINNNGNVSFGAAYSTFTASGFPNSNFVMVAPFWGDVDTRGAGSGLVYYKITPTYLEVQWDSVGYFNAYYDKLNTFQLIITNGSDPIVPGGNVSFCYKNMAWTTGDASGGVNGFNGADAVVGANKGDGVNYIQFGEFNQPGSTYNGPLGINSGIDWLDNQSFIFDACTNSNNIPPTVNGLAVCDTLTLCEGDTLPLNVTFFSPEGGQTTTITVDTTGVSGYVETSNTPGNTASLVAYFLGSAANAGYSLVTITATDNGTPNGITSIPIIIHVVPAPVIVASNDTTICNGSSALLVSSGGTSYSWSPAGSLSNANVASPIATPTVTTTYTVTVSDGGCSRTEPVTVNVQTPAVVAGPDSSICLNGVVILHATGGVSYSWNPTIGLSNPNIANPVANPTVTTTYTVTVTDAIGCTATDAVTVTVNPSPVPLFTALPNTAFIDSVFTFADGSTGAVSWTWHFGDGNSSTQQNPTHSYSAAGTYNVCLVVTSSSGCVDSTCTDVIVVPHGIVPPNVFTPNGDNINDMLVFLNLEYYPNSMLQIYDRWGVLVYENGNYLNDWNGGRNGGSSDCVDGTYYYILTGPNIETPLTGFVTLIRGK